jgi:hypothetical protein
VSDRSLVWLTQRGSVAAVSRGSERKLWSHDLAPALFSNNQPPFTWNDYLYVEPKRGTAALIAYRTQ